MSITASGGLLRSLGLSATIALTVGVAGSATASTDAQVDSMFAAVTKEAPVVHDITPNERGIYIVGLRAAPLALYTGSDLRSPPIPRKANKKIDLASAAAVRYVDLLKSEQQSFLDRFSARVGRTVEPTSPQMQFQHAFNGFVLELTPAELSRLASEPDVALIEGYREYALATDVGPAFIGAPAIWDGIATPTPAVGTRGEGIVIGVIDSGANIASPSFTATDMDGYTHVNPLGDGNFLGWCDPANPNHVPARDICNSKVIGGWDFADGTVAPGGFEAPGFEDENGHGSHTASTAGGNVRTGTINGANVTLSGVAPRANLVIYDVCYTTSAGQGTCANSATLAAINQTVVDGIIDVINYSISGGAQPWLEANSQAFLAANNAGIYVSVSGGNSGPAAGTVGHSEPWVTSVAASTHTRAGFGNLFSVTGPTTPAGVTNLPTRPGVAAPINVNPLVNVPLILSPNFGTATTDGCSAYPAGTFQRSELDAQVVFQSGFDDGEPGVPTVQRGAIALIRWPTTGSTCGTVARANNAVAAGAVGALFVPETTLNAAGGAQAPVYVLYDVSTHAAVLAAINANPGTVVGTINAETVALIDPSGADVMAGFSSRGPTPFAMLKPDVSAPGVQVLAAFSRWIRNTAPGTLDPAGGPNLGVISGTSMASPHNAGSAALLRALHPDWTPSEVKTALMTTSLQSMRKEDASTPADPFDRGAGRINLNRAGLAGLVMDETGANYTAANPGANGDPATLNIASFQRSSCIGTCAFVREARNVNAGVTWTASFEGLPAGAGSVLPANIMPDTVTPTSFTVSVDSALLPPNVWSFGQLVWTPNDPDVPVARMPIAVRSAGPALEVPQSAIVLSVQAGSQDTRSITVNNVGNPTLNWVYASGSTPATFIDQGPQLGNGFRGSEHAVSETATGYAADDFVLPADGAVNYLQSNGFVLPGGTTLASATSINFRIYADNGGAPAGAPRFGTNVGDAPLWQASLPPTNAGLSIATAGTNGNISLDLVAAGLTPPNLPAGRYWMLVYPILPGSGAPSAGNPLWAAAIVGVGAPVSGLAPRSRNAEATATWEVPTLINPPGPGPAAGFSMVSRGTVTCGAPWMTPSVASGMLGLGGSQSVTVTFNTTGLAAGTYGAAICITSNGGSRTVPVALTVTPAP